MVWCGVVCLWVFRSCAHKEPRHGHTSRTSEASKCFHTGRRPQSPCRLRVSAELPSSSLISLSVSVLTAIFPGEPGLAGFIGAKDGGGGDNWSYKTWKAPVISWPTNKPTTANFCLWYFALTALMTVGVTMCVTEITVLLLSSEVLYWNVVWDPTSPGVQWKHLSM